MVAAAGQVRKANRAFGRCQLVRNECVAGALDVSRQCGLWTGDFDICVEVHVSITGGMVCRCGSAIGYTCAGSENGRGSGTSARCVVRRLTQRVVGAFRLTLFCRLARSCVNVVAWDCFSNLMSVALGGSCSLAEMNPIFAGT